MLSGLIALISLLTLIRSSRAHGYIMAIEGSNGRTVNGFGVREATSEPTFTRAFATVLGQRPGCGTLDISEETQNVLATVPTFTAGRQISANYIQINPGSDGGPPLVAAVDQTGTGSAFVPLNFTKAAVGAQRNSVHPIAFSTPRSLKCEGPGGTCLFRVQNFSALAYTWELTHAEFGSCFVMKQVKRKAQLACASPKRLVKTKRRVRTRVGVVAVKAT